MNKKSLGLIIVCVISIVFAILVSSNVLAITGSIGNARMILYSDVGFWGTTIEKSIIVNNVNDEQIKVRLEASGNDSKMFTIVDDEFTMQPGETKNAVFKIKVTKAGNYEGRINVYFTPLSGSGAGVVLTSTIIVHAKGEGSDSSENDNQIVVDENGTVIQSNTTRIGGNVLGSKNFMLVLIAIPIILAIILITLIILTKKRKRADRSS